MSTYAIGDLQGCYDPFRKLLDQIDFDPAKDSLWLTGDLVNRGPKSLKVVRFVRSLGDSRPAWKVLRVLGNLLNVGGFDYDTSEVVRDDVLAKPVTDRLSNVTTAQTAAPAAVAAGIERLADVPIYHADPIVRRAGSLQLTAAARAAVRAGLPADLFAQLGLANGDAVRVTMQGQGSVVLPAVLDRSLAAGVIRVPAATEASAQLGAMFGAVNVEKVESSALAATV